MNNRFLPMIVGFLAMALAVLAVAPVILGEATLRAPRRSTGSWTGGGTRQDVEIRAADGARLRGWLLRPPAESGRCVMVLHGVGDSRRGSSGFATMFLERGDTVLLPDSRAQGLSEGAFVTYGLLEKYDVLRWADWLQDQGCHELYGLGESLGGSVLIQAAGERPVFGAIAVECPYSTLEAVARYRVRRMAPMPEWAARGLVRAAMLYARTRYGVDLRAVSALRAIQRTTTPVLLIHGTADRETPPSNSEELRRANPGAVLWRVPGARHVGAWPAAPEEFTRRVLGWLQPHNGKTRAKVSGAAITGQSEFG